MRQHANPRRLSEVTVQQFGRAGCLVDISLVLSKIDLVSPISTSKARFFEYFTYSPHCPLRQASHRTSDRLILASDTSRLRLIASSSPSSAIDPTLAERSYSSIELDENQYLHDEMAALVLAGNWLQTLAFESGSRASFIEDFALE
jgi:hypothetical protein